MLISCEKCSTTYELDSSLIPPEGAPVQCTNCQHVFTARHPPAPAPKPLPLTARPGNSTMMFGASPAPKNQTMMFGAGAVPPVAPQSSPPASKNQTMMFGAPAVPPVAPVAPQSSPPASKNQTMMFGAPVVPPVAPQSSPPASKNQTMMFGAPAVPPVAPQSSPPASKNQTMMFGAPAVAAGPVPQPSPASSRQTMVFGSAAAAPPPQAATSQTMIFGTAAPVAADPGEPPGEETLLEQPGQSSRTVLFGLAQPPDAVPTAPPPAPKNQTMMFGRPVAPAIPKVTVGTVELAGIAADEDKPNESTVRVDLGQTADETAGDDAAGDAASEVQARHDRTQRYAMDEMGGGPTPPGGQDAVQARHNRTQLFAMSTGQDVTDSAGRAVPSSFSVEPVPAGAAMVGDSTLPPTGADRFAPQPLQADLATTLPPDAPVPPVAPRQRFDPPGISSLNESGPLLPVAASRPEPGPVASTLPSLPPLDSRPLSPLPLELPPEPSGSPRELLAAQQRMESERAGQAQRSAARGGGAGRVIVILLALIALALAGVLAWRLLGRPGKNVLPQFGEAMGPTADALATLRRDDAEAQDRAAAQVKPLLGIDEHAHAARAVLVLVAALRLDDEGALLRLEEQKAKALQLAADGQGEAADTARAQLETLAPLVARQRTSVETRRAALERELGALRALDAPEEGSASELAVLRAEAFARAVLGDGQALAMAERARQVAQGPDDWAELAVPEYALNGGSSREEALATIEAVLGRANNSTFVRPHVLSARLHLLGGDDQRAQEVLETVVTMNGKHVVAQRLLATIQVPAAN